MLQSVLIFYTQMYRRLTMLRRIDTVVVEDVSQHNKYSVICFDANGFISGKYILKYSLFNEFYLFLGRVLLSYEQYCIDPIDVTLKLQKSTTIYTKPYIALTPPYLSGVSWNHNTQNTQDSRHKIIM